MGENIGKKNRIEIDTERNIAILYLLRKDSFPANDPASLRARRIGILPVYIDNDPYVIQEVDQFRWSASYSNAVGCLPYASSTQASYMHRMLWRLIYGDLPRRNADGDPLIVDHVNDLRHDNRLSNLALIPNDDNWRRRRKKYETPHFDPYGITQCMPFPSVSRNGVVYHSHVYVYNIWLGHFPPHESDLANHVMHLAQFLLDHQPNRKDIHAAFAKIYCGVKHAETVLQRTLSLLHWNPPFLD